MKNEEAAPEGVWQYKARWRSTMGSLTLATGFFAALLLLVALVGPRIAPGFLVGGACLAAITWLLGKPLFTGAWIVRIGPRGISGYLLRGRTVPWRDIRDVGVETVQGNTFLVLHLAPDATESLQKTKRWASGTKPERRIVLNGLRKEEAAAAVQAAMRMFAEQAREHASAAIAARQEEARREVAFQQELTRHTRTPWALYVVVAINAGVWVLNVAKGVSAMAPATADLFRWGAISAWAVSREGEFWRLLTGAFLHAGLVHLAMNMLGLWGAGKLLNRLIGNGQFLLVYVLSALAGASASLHFGAQTAVSVGASGAVFGVIGALVACVSRSREHLPKAVVKQIMTSEAVFLAYALLNGFTRQGIDNAAHVGGLVAGGAMGWLLVGVVDASQQGARNLRAALASAGVVAAIAGMVVTTPSPAVDHAAMFAAAHRMHDIMPRWQAANVAMQNDVRQAQARRMTEEQFLRKLETVHLPALRRFSGELRQVPRAAGDPRAELTSDIQEFTDTSIDLLEVQLRVDRAQALPDDAARAQALKARIQAITHRLQERAAAQKARKNV